MTELALVALALADYHNRAPAAVLGSLRLGKRYEPPPDTFDFLRGWRD